MTSSPFKPEPYFLPLTSYGEELVVGRVLIGGTWSRLVPGTFILFHDHFRDEEGNPIEETRALYFSAEVQPTEEAQQDYLDRHNTAPVGTEVNMEIMTLRGLYSSIQAMETCAD